MGWVLPMDQSEVQDCRTRAGGRDRRLISEATGLNVDSSGQI